MVWNLVDLQLTNFISHGDTKFTFEANKTTLVIGKNLTDEGQNSNGSGKSTLAEALYFCITGGSLRQDITQVDLVRDSCQQGSVLARFQTFTDDILTVERTVRMKGSSSVEVILNGEIQRKTSINEFNQYIQQLLGLDAQQLLSGFIVTKDRYKSWFLQTDSEKKQTIIELAQAASIDRTIDHLKSIIKELDNQLQIGEVGLSHIQGKLAGIKSTIDEFSGTTKDEPQKIIDTYLEQIALFEEMNRTDKTREEALTAQITLIQNTVTTLNTNKPQIADKQQLANTKLGRLRGDVYTHQQSIVSLNKKIGTNAVILAGKVACPQCTHEFIPHQHQHEPKVLQAEIEQFGLQITAIEQEVDKIQKQIAKGEQFVLDLTNELAKWNQEFDVERNKLISIQQLLNTTETTIVRRENEIARIRNEINTVSTPSTQLDKLKANLADLEKEQGQLTDQQNTLRQKRAFHIKWVDAFSKFRNFVVSQTARHFTDLINHYLHLLNTNLFIDVRGMTELKSGKTSAKISAHVVRNGRPAGSFGKLSSGERIRISLSAILAQHKMYNTLSDNGLNLLFLDEVIESLDDEGVSTLLSALDSINTTIVAITHATSSQVWRGRTFCVTKSNGISSI